MLSEQGAKNPTRTSNCSHPVCTVLLSEAWGLQERDLSVGIQVLLVPAQDDDNVLARQHPGITQPRGQGVVRLPTAERRDKRVAFKRCGQRQWWEKRLEAEVIWNYILSPADLPCDIVDQQGSCRSSVVTPGHRPAAHTKTLGYCTILHNFNNLNHINARQQANNTNWR